MKKITSVLLAVVMLFALCMPTLAADEISSLKASAMSGNGTVVVKISAGEATTNGKFVVEFDQNCLTYVSCEVEGVLTHVSESTGSVTISYATTTAQAVAAGEMIIKVRFEVSGSWTITNIPVIVKEFNSNESLNEEVANLIVVNPNEGSVPTPPTPPTPPAPPAEDEDEAKPGVNIEVPELTEERYYSIVTQYPDAEDHWAEENIVKAINAGLFNGTAENTFTPDGVVTRGMFVTLLYRLSGEPEVSGEMPFTDVPAAQYYAKAVIWAQANNIVNGVTDTEFAPDAEVSREQMVTMLYRFAKTSGADVSNKTSLKGFGDAAAVSNWAAEAMSWAVAEGIINGAGGNLNPADQSTRAQIATVLVRYAQL